MNNATIYLKDYQAPSYLLTTVSLQVDLYDDHALITNTMHVLRQKPGALELSGEALELIALEIDGVALTADQYRLHEQGLTILSCQEVFDLTITTRIQPQDNTVLSGLYRSNELFCTQCEAEGFRRITYFLDRPDVMAVYHTRISADKARFPVLLSNGNLVDSGDLPQGRHWVLWHDPFKKPCYLFALVAGDLNCYADTFTTASGRHVDLMIYTEKGKGYETQCAHAMQSLKAAMRWDEIEFGREYDLDRYMIVAVHDFNMGAMENKGLNIFNAKYILANPTIASDDDYFGVESVVAHEYFHNWTGNRVTCRDWFQLSLKEGLTVFRDQEFSRDMNSRDVCRIQDVIALRNTQFPEDSGSMAHPVQPQSYQEINNFYTATVYNKGAEVIRMQQTLLGKAGFRQGMDLYFKRHDGQAVTIDDFVKAMEDANGADLTQFKRWYSQAGTPKVSVTTQFQAPQLSVTLTQSCEPTADGSPKEPFHIPVRVSLFSPQGQAWSQHSRVLSLTKPTQTWVFDGLSTEPLVSILQDFSAPVLLDYPLPENKQLALLRCESNGFVKWHIAQQMFLSSIHACYHARPPAWQVSSSFTDTLRYLLHEETDHALCAELLTPPSLDESMVSLCDVDVHHLLEAREFVMMAIGKALASDFDEIYHALWREEDHQMHGLAYARRALRNLCLWYLMKADEATYLPLCQQQYQQAVTMTDKAASCRLLMSSEQERVRLAVIDDFYQMWKDNDLVMDKWLSMQAQSRQSGSIAHIETLLKHSVFDLKNPNKVRALISVFAMHNPWHFHAVDGSGYMFLANMLLQIDKLNPQVAARLAIPFTRGKRYDNPRRQIIARCLRDLSRHDLSNDLQEMVSKSQAIYEH